MLTVEDLAFHYKGRPEVLRDVHFTVNTGEFLAILGNNGVGKSTMLKCFNRILVPDRGKIVLDGEDLLQLTTRQIAQRVAFVAQNVPGTQMTVHDMVMLGRRPYMKWGFTEEDHQIVHRAMEQLRVEPLRGRFLNELSGGERQKVVLARALAQQPKLLLLDEPTSSLDIRNQYQVLETVQTICHSQQLTAIIVIHDLNLALRFCDRFVLMRQGGVYACGGREVLDRSALRDVYHVDAEVVDVKNQSIVLIDEKDTVCTERKNSYGT